MEKKQENHFGYAKLLWIFIIGSIFGAYYEEILNMFIHYHYHHEWVYVYRRGLIYGPLSPIYGAGAVLMTLLLVKSHKNNNITFLKGAFIGGAFEYLISFLQETFIGSVSWDYSNEFLNINGRTTVPYMIVWGLLALVFVKVVYPWIDKMLAKIPEKINKWLTKSLTVFLILDVFLSFGALIRQYLRHLDIPAYTFVGRTFDSYYTDEFLKKYYTNMTFIEGEK